MTHALVTGATGFIGYHLVKHLSDHGVDVSCLVRESSDRSRLELLQPRFLVGDVTDPDSVRRAVADVHVVYHLAGLTKTLRRADLITVNEGGTRNVSAACAELSQPPVLVVVSSLAAAGPAINDRPRTEYDPATPVSAYGKSKRAGELAAIEFASSVPTTIVRPPVVLGEGDRDGFVMFEGIAKLGIHLVPTLADHEFSLIHAEDLAAAITQSASSGHRIKGTGDQSEGIYFAAADEMLTYAGLGRMIGEVLGRPNVRMIRTPEAFVWTVAGFNELVSRVRRRPHILSFDKAREATAGSWTCSTDKLRSETGFVPAKPLRQRLHQTAQWYIEQGWLRKPKQWPQPQVQGLITKPEPYSRSSQN